MKAYIGINKSFLVMLTSIDFQKCDCETYVLDLQYLLTITKTHLQCLSEQLCIFEVLHKPLFFSMASVGGF